MPKYEYKARDRDGLLIEEELEVETEEMLINHLENMGYTLESSKEKIDVFEDDILEKISKVKSKLIVEFSVEISTLLEAGVPLLNALEVMEEQIADERFKRIIGAVKKDITRGLSFSEALEKHPKAFKKIYVSMVRAGEATGELDEILKSLAKFLEIEHNNKSRMLSAMIYPVFMFFMAIFVILFLVIKILPKFVSIFKQAGVKLPFITSSLINTSNFLIYNWKIILLITILLILGIMRYKNTEKGAYYTDYLKFKIPIFGKILKKSSITRFARTLGTLIESSVPILQSLTIVKDTVGNKVISNVIENIRASVRQGGIISEEVELSAVFPAMVTKMIAVGENTGSMDKMLLKVADFYDNELENQIKGLSSLLEPIMIVFMGGVVGIIVLSVMLPMFDMIKVARR